MKKTFRKLKEEIANVSSGIGVRGFGDVTGTPKVDVDDEQDNPHIQRVVQGSQENNNQVRNLVDNQTKGLYTFNDPNWWAKPGAKGTSLTGLGKSMNNKGTIKEGMEKDHYKAIDDIHVNLDNRNHAIEDYGYGPLNPNEESADFWQKKADLWQTTIEEAKKSRCGNCAAFNKSKEIRSLIAQGLGPVGKTITEKADLGFCEMFHFKCAADRTCDAWLVNGPIKEEIGGFAGTVGSSAGSGYIAGVGVPLEGKPANWGEPGVSPQDQKKKRKRKDDPRLFGMFRRKAQPEMTDALKEIPIQEVKQGMFAGETTFIVPESVYERAMLAKAKGKHWRTYIMNETVYPAIRQYAETHRDKPIIFENEKNGYMCYARYGKRKK